MSQERTESILDWFERVHLSHLIKYVRTHDQLEDILTKGTFAMKKWQALLHLWQVTFEVFPSNPSLATFPLCTPDDGSQVDKSRMY